MMLSVDVKMDMKNDKEQDNYVLVFKYKWRQLVSKYWVATYFKWTFPLMKLHVEWKNVIFSIIMTENLS